MKIGDNYKLETEDSVITLYEKEADTWIAICYFPDLKIALEYVVDNELTKSGIEDVKSILNKINDLHRMIESIK